jgi:hypothetical protein
MLNCRHQWELFRVVHLEIVGVHVGLNSRRWRRLSLRVGFAFIATKEEQAQR